MLIASNAYGADSISSFTGDLVDGEDIVIAGTFTAKTTAAPMKHETWDSGSNGQDVDVFDSGWIGYTSTAVLDNSQAWNGTLSAANEEGEDGAFLSNYLTFSGQTVVYYSYRFRYDVTDPTTLTQVKLGRIGNDTTFGRTGQDPNPYAGGATQALSGFREFDGYAMQCLIDWNSNYFQDEYNANDEFSPWYFSGESGFPTAGSWHRVEQYHQLSVPAGTANGESKAWIDYINLYSRETATTRGSGMTWDINCVLLGTMSGNDSATNMDLYVDDVYVDNTYQRVELGNNAVFANCTKRKLLIPSVWATDEITATVSTINFSSGETAYLFVVDGDNVASAGYETEIGESGTPPEDPDPPSVANIKGRIYVS